MPKHIDRRKLTAAERPDRYAPKRCEFCGVEFIPKTGSAKYCPDHSRGSWERNHPEDARAAAREKTRRYRSKNPEAIRLVARRDHLRRQYGDPNIYEALAERYGERCAICGTKPKSGAYLDVDHSHAAATLRGLLCRQCNMGLGYFRDDGKRLRAAAAYLDGQLL